MFDQKQYVVIAWFLQSQFLSVVTLLLRSLASKKNKSCLLLQFRSYVVLFVLGWLGILCTPGPDMMYGIQPKTMASAACKRLVRDVAMSLRIDEPRPERCSGVGDRRASQWRLSTFIWLRLSLHKMALLAYFQNLTIRAQRRDAGKRVKFLGYRY